MFIVLMGVLVLMSAFFFFFFFEGGGGGGGMVVFIKCAVCCYTVAPGVNFSEQITKYLNLNLKVLSRQIQQNMQF